VAYDFKTVLRSIAPLAVLTLGFGCAPFGAPHITLHPSRIAASNAAGVSAGGMYSSTTTDPEPPGASDVNSSTFSLPYGEGWARFGLGQGQLELRASSNAASVGYRLDLVGSPSLAVALVPELGAGYWSTKQETEISGATNSISAFTVSPTVTLILMFGGGAFYLGPRVGFQYVSLTSEDSDGDQTDETSAVWALGGALGTILPANPFDISLEAAAYGFFGSGEAETAGGMAVTDFDQSGFLIVGSVGIQLSAPTRPAAAAAIE